MQRLILGLLLLIFAALGQARDRLGEYALVLRDPPVAQKSQSREALRSPQSLAYGESLRRAQRSVLEELARRKVAVTAADQILVNAVFVSAEHGTAAKLRNIPGVQYVQYLPPLRRHLDRAVNLVNAPAAWSAVGGASNAGAGIKIGIIDTGIDQNHPGFQDNSLQPPGGFPKGDTGFTNNKVIVARSYVSMLDSTDPTISSPDDFSPRDRVGHGTAIAMIAAGVQNQGPVAAIQGIAPKAFLGNYKIFGSPGLNDFTLFSAVDQALKDALADGMDIVTLSLGEGDPAVSGPLDVDNTNCGGACDVRAQAIENASGKGMVVVASAGNGGNLGDQFPTLDTIDSPGTAPSAITVGASTNSHILFQAVHVNGSNVPSNLQNIHALFGDGPKIASPRTAPLRDVAQLGNDGLACSALPAGSLTGAVALIQRGTCTFSDKINNAQNAGAVAVILYQASGQETPFSSLGAQDTGIPAMMIGNSDGVALKNFIGSKSSATATLDPALSAVDAQFNTVAAFSSRGPSIGSFAVTPTFVIKPEVVAVGTDLYTATQKFDPNGDTYDPSGYTTVSGTSYAVPVVAGAVALVKQKNSAIKTPAQLKSSVVNTATQDVTDLDGSTARVNAVGAGKLSVGDAVNVAATLEPATISFGAIAPASLPINRTVTITNVGGSAATFSLTVKPRDSDSNARVSVSPSSVTLAPGQQNSVTVALGGSRPIAGSYEGFIEVTGAGPTLHLPYLYFVGDGVPFNVFPVLNGSFIGAPDFSERLIGFKLVDRFGVPVVGQQVLFTLPNGASFVKNPDNPALFLVDPATDRTGIAAAKIHLGAQTGDQIFTAQSGGLSVDFFGFARNFPSINANGVVDAASFRVGQGLAPGSYISIFGTELADAAQVESTPALPVSLSSVSVSFDGGGKSLPGHLHFVSPGQVNVQIPWEFQGDSSVAMKVTIGLLSTLLYNLPLAAQLPGIFEVIPGSAAVLDLNFKVVNQANPAIRGKAIQIFANGLGPVTHQPASGDPSPAGPLAETQIRPSVTIGGRPAQVLFSGLAPGLVGLYQVNVVVPADAPTGTQPLVLSINGIDSKASNLPVQ